MPPQRSNKVIGILNANSFDISIFYAFEEGLLGHIAQAKTILFLTNQRQKKSIHQTTRQYTIIKIPNAYLEGNLTYPYPMKNFHYNLGQYTELPASNYDCAAEEDQILVGQQEGNLEICLLQQVPHIGEPKKNHKERAVKNLKKHYFIRKPEAIIKPNLYK